MNTYEDAISMVENKVYDMHYKAGFFIYDIIGVYHALVGSLDWVNRMPPGSDQTQPFANP